MPDSCDECLLCLYGKAACCSNRAGQIDEVLVIPEIEEGIVARSKLTRVVGLRTKLITTSTTITCFFFFGFCVV